MIELKVTGSQWSEILEQVGPITGPHLLETKPVELEALKAVVSPAVLTNETAPVEVPAATEPMAMPPEEMHKKPAKKATPKKTAVEAPRSDESVKVDEVSTPEAKTQDTPAESQEIAIPDRDEVRALCLKLRDAQGIGRLKLVFTALGKSKFDQFSPEEYPALVAEVTRQLEM